MLVSCYFCLTLYLQPVVPISCLFVCGAQGFSPLWNFENSIFRRKPDHSSDLSGEHLSWCFPRRMCVFRLLVPREISFQNICFESGLGSGQLGPQKLAENFYLNTYSFGSVKKNVDDQITNIWKEHNFCFRKYSTFFETKSTLNLSFVKWNFRG